MPYASFSVELRLDPRIQSIPEKHRATCVALYSWAVLYSAELLTDGHVPTVVMIGLAHEIGISRGRYERSEVRKHVTSLVSAGLLEETKTGVQIIDWTEFHSSRSDVEKKRAQAAERKRRSRGQLQMLMPSQRDVPELSQRDEGRDSRARAPARAPSPSPTDVNPSAVNGASYAEPVSEFATLIGPIEAELEQAQRARHQAADSTGSTHETEETT